MRPATWPPPPPGVTGATAHHATGDDYVTLQDGNEPALLNDGDDKTAEQPATIVDVDLQELNEARAAAKAEEEAKGQDEGRQEETTEAPADETPPQDQSKGKQPAPMIPKARLDEVLSERDKHLQEAAYWRGVAESRVGKPTDGQPPQEPPITPEQHLAAIRLQQEALAKKFDEGELTMTDYVKQSHALDDLAQSVREDALLAKVKPAAQPNSSDDFGLASETARLEEAHPWVKVLEQIPNNDADWNYLRGVAISNLASRGIDAAAGKYGTYQLRREIAELADQYGPTLFGPRAKAAGLTLPDASQQQQQKPALSPTAQARQAKLGTMASAPPNIAGMSGAGADTGMPSAARIEEMSDDDIGNLPDSVRRKLLGIT